MSSIVISVENLSKVYRLGQIGTGTLTNDLKVWWAKTRGKPSPLLKIGQADHGNRDGEELWALKDVSFTVEQGEVLGIIGRNGAGKSTLLKILSRVTAPTSGKVKVKGHIASLLEVGTGFHPELTGRENIYLNGAILGMKRTEIGRKFDVIVDFSGVEKFIDTPVKRYSSGMYVRLAFAVAAHLEPEILVVDEVLAVGDAAFQRKCLGKMGDVAKEGRTVLFVSHNMGAIKALCQSGIYLDNGKIACRGNVMACVDAYINPSQIEAKPYVEFKENVNLPIQFLSLSVVDEDGKLAPHHPFDRSFWLRMEVLVRSKITNVYLAAHIHDSDMSTLLFTRDFEGDESNLLQREPGLYVYSIRIPAPLLVPGKYQVSAHAARSAPPQLIDGVDHVCPFEIVDSGSTRAKMGFPWHGKISTPLEWTCISVNQQVESISHE